MLALNSEAEPLPDLPPLPPRAETRWKETRLGVLTVGGTISLCLSLGHATLLPPGLSPTTVRILLGLLYVESAVALVCLLGILFVDPGVVHRSPETCHPLPEEVAYRLASREPQREAFASNLSEGDKVYCVRCFVWRDHDAQRVGLLTRLLQLRWLDKRKPRGHHCRTCQRCVLYFDHHCGGEPAPILLTSPERCGEQLCPLPTSLQHFQQCGGSQSSALPPSCSTSRPQNNPQSPPNSLLHSAPQIRLS